MHLWNQVRHWDPRGLLLICNCFIFKRVVLECLKFLPYNHIIFGAAKAFNWCDDSTFDKKITIVRENNYIWSNDVFIFRRYTIAQVFKANNTCKLYIHVTYPQFAQLQEFETRSSKKLSPTSCIAIYDIRCSFSRAMHAYTIMRRLYIVEL